MWYVAGGRGGDRRGEQRHLAKTSACNGEEYSTFCFWRDLVVLWVVVIKERRGRRFRCSGARLSKVNRIRRPGQPHAGAAGGWVEKSDGGQRGRRAGAGKRIHIITACCPSRA